MAETAYIVLRQHAKDGWEIVDQQTGTPASAIRKAVTKRQANEDDQTLTADGTYVAIPARSWKPVTVKAIQTTSIKLGAWDEAGTAPIDIGSD